jgi:futalosine hydrolase
MKITLLFPTKTEASLFQRDDVDVIISGVGLTATAISTLRAIQQNKPDVLILAGIAGAFTDSTFKMSDVVLVESEVEGDLGFFTPAGFVHLAHLPLEMDFERRHTLICPYLPPATPFKLARSVSLNAAMAPFIDSKNVDIENMEGAAFFHVCLQEKQRFLELRAISNMVKIGDDNWDMQGSVLALTDSLHRLIDLLIQQERMPK